MISALLVMGLFVCMGGCFLFLLTTWYGSTDFAATRRWKRTNARQPKACLCGAPGTVKRPSSYPVRGSVRPFWWYCDAHADVPLNTPWTSGRPMVQARDGVWHEPIESLVARGLVRLETDEEYRARTGRDA